MKCRLCCLDLPEKMFSEIKNKGCISGRRKVCRQCRTRKQRRPETMRANALRAYYKKKFIDPEFSNRKAREYRKLRRENGNPIQRDCSSDKFRKSGRFKAKARAEVRDLYGSLCMYCLAPAPTIDHVVPLARGGSDEIGNLVPACWSCNSSKQDYRLLVWMVKRRVAISQQNTLTAHLLA